MYFAHVALLIVGGILAAAGLILARKPDAKELIDKITPYQGYIGGTLFAWGLYNLIFTVLMNIGLMFSSLVFIVIFIAVLTEVVLGFMLAFGLITKYALSKNETALAKGQAIRAKLAPFQGIIGLIGIGVGVALLVVRFI
ncbi:MAG: hypothetical protein JRH20_16630 [Deltaproteobacteria bacterium]|nr:hypothetical protein [Deltaproteobacteria bacterium]